MAKIFDVGPLPQILPPTIVDTKPLIPFEFAQMAQSANQKEQLERQKTAMDLQYMTKFHDDLEGLLKSPDGTFLNPISKFHQKTFADVADQTNKAVQDISRALDADDYRGAYDKLFEAKTKVRNNTDYKRTLQELSLFKDRLGDKELDPWAINKLYEELGASDTAFDLTRFNRSELTIYDEPTSIKNFLTKIKPEEVLNYDGYKYEVQQTPDQIRNNLTNLIKQDAGWVRHLRNRNIDVNNPDQLNNYIDSQLSGNLIADKAGAEYLYQTIDGKETLVGIKRLVGFDKGLNEAATGANEEEADPGVYVSLFDGPENATQQIVRATPEVVDFKSFRSSFRDAYSNYNSVSQAVDELFKGKTIHGLVSNSNDKVEDFVNTVSSLGLEGARNVIKITDANGVVDEASEKRFFEKTLPEAITAYTNKQIYLKGNETLLEGSYDKIKAEFDKKGTGKTFEDLGITKGSKGEIIFPEGFDLDGPRGTRTEYVDTPMGRQPRTIAADPASDAIKDAHTKYIDSKLKGRYEQYFKPEADVLKYWVLPQETGQDFAPMRIQADNIRKSVVDDRQSFYSADEKLTGGLPMTMAELTAKERPQGIDGKQSWNDVRIDGIGLDAETGQFFVYGFPRTTISPDEFDEYRGAKKNTAYTNQFVEEDGGQRYLTSKKGIVIPWNKFGTEFYASFFEKFKTYEGLYSSMIDAMEEKVPEGQPIRIDIGGRPLFITPKGPIGPDRIYQMSVPGQIAAHVEQEPLPPATVSNVSTSAPPKNYVEVRNPPATPEDVSVARDSMEQTIAAKPWLKDVLGPLFNPAHDPASAPSATQKQIEAENKQLGSTNEELIYLYPHLKDVITGKDTGGAAPRPTGLGDADLIGIAERVTRIYEGPAAAMDKILSRGATYINGLDDKQKAEVLNPANFTALQFKNNPQGTNTPLKTTPRTAAALAHYNKYISNEFSGDEMKGIISDTFRTEDQNAKTPGSGENSKHKEGDAFDISLRGSGSVVLKRVQDAQKKGKEEENKLYRELFGTDKVKFEYHTKGTAPHIHVEITG